MARLASALLQQNGAEGWAGAGGPASGRNGWKRALRAGMFDSTGKQGSPAPGAPAPPADCTGNRRSVLAPQRLSQLAIPCGAGEAGCPPGQLRDVLHADRFARRPLAAHKLGKGGGQIAGGREGRRRQASRAGQKAGQPPRRSSAATSNGTWSQPSMQSTRHALPAPHLVPLPTSSTLAPGLSRSSISSSA